MNFTIIDNKVIFNTGKEIDLNFPILEREVIGDILIVRTDSPIGKVYNENVFAIDTTEKRILWQVPKIQYTKIDSPYSGIMIDKLTKTTIDLYNRSGVAVTVNYRTGVIIGTELVK